MSQIKSCRVLNIANLKGTVSPELIIFFKGTVSPELLIFFKGTVSPELLIFFKGTVSRELLIFLKRDCVTRVAHLFKGTVSRELLIFLKGLCCESCSSCLTNSSWCLINRLIQNYWTIGVFKNDLTILKHPNDSASLLKLFVKWILIFYLIL